jgi:hypothetical protein
MKLSISLAVVILAIAGTPTGAQESSRDDFTAFCQVFKGRWVGQAVLPEDMVGLGKKGDKVASYAVNKMALDGNALICEGYTGNGSVMLVFTFDPGDRQIKGLWMTSAGHVTRSVAYKNADGDWIEEGVRSTPDGTKTQFRRSVVISENGKTHTWTGGAPIGGDEGVEHRDVWRRVSE